jgi:DNA-binding CsgD family transcriptional regulator
MKVSIEKQKNKGGRRPIVLNDEQITELETLAKDMTIEQIADHFGISEESIS